MRGEQGRIEDPPTQFPRVDKQLLLVLLNVLRARVNQRQGTFSKMYGWVFGGLARISTASRVLPLKFSIPWGYSVIRGIYYMAWHFDHYFAKRKQPA